MYNSASPQYSQRSTVHSIDLPMVVFVPQQVRLAHPCSLIAPTWITPYSISCGTFQPFSAFFLFFRYFRKWYVPSSAQLTLNSWYNDHTNFRMNIYSIIKSVSTLPRYDILYPKPLCQSVRKCKDRLYIHINNHTVLTDRLVPTIAYTPRLQSVLARYPFVLSRHDSHDESHSEAHTGQ